MTTLIALFIICAFAVMAIGVIAIAEHPRKALMCIAGVLVFIFYPLICILAWAEDEVMRAEMRHRTKKRMRERAKHIAKSNI